MQNIKIRVLFADDHEDTRLIVTTLLGASGFQVITADGVASALALAHSEAFDVYLLDSKLSDGTGRELCMRLREFDRDTPVVFFSGDVYEADKQSALNAGAQGFVAKPNISALPRALAIVLDAASRAH